MTDTSVPAAGARAPGRISAGHFRRLTAKLKGEELDLPVSHALKKATVSIPDLFEAAPAVVAVESAAPSPVEEPDPDYAVAVVETPDAALTETVAEATPAVGSFLDVETEPQLAAFELPQFPDIPPFRPDLQVDPADKAEAEAVRDLEMAELDPTPDIATMLPADSVVALETAPVEDLAPAADLPPEDQPEEISPEPVDLVATAPVLEQPVQPEPAEVPVADSLEIAVSGDEATSVDPDPVGAESAESSVQDAMIEAAVEADPLEVAPEPAPDGEAEPVAEVQPAAEPDMPALASVLPPVAVQDHARPLAPMADRVVEAMIKTIADSVYAKPTVAERTAFLREIAELAKVQDEVPAPEPEASAPPVPVVAELVVEVVPEPVPPPPPAQASLLLKPKPEPDVFATTFKVLAEPKPAETAEADEASGELALSLLDMMSMGASSGLPQERALASDTLLRILPRIPVKQLLAVVERIAIMENPPALLVAKLIRDPRPEVVAPLLERCMHITDQDLIGAAGEADAGKRRMIARRRLISPVLSDRLISLGDPSVVLTLIRNPGATFSHDAFYVLAGIASENPALLAPLVTRADLPPPVAFELFWFAPPELRRFILSRFLTDSETLNKILRITLATGSDGELPSADSRFPPRETIDTALELVTDFRLEEAAQVLSDAAGINRDTALRIFADREGEPMAVILKALGYPRGLLTDAMVKLGNGDNAIIRPGRIIEELQNVFDSLSFNKARILLTYWDWYVRKSGPYAPRH
jgi:uncharacterized protein (DUF2336 family)